jgi:hypothetical protein
VGGIDLKVLENLVDTEMSVLRSRESKERRTCWASLSANSFYQIPE